LAIVQSRPTDWAGVISSAEQLHPQSIFRVRSECDYGRNVMVILKRLLAEWNVLGHSHRLVRVRPVTDDRCCMWDNVHRLGLR